MKILIAVILVLFLNTTYAVDYSYCSRTCIKTIYNSMTTANFNHPYLEITNLKIGDDMNLGYVKMQLVDDNIFKVIEVKK